jgi:hypothetical protein
MPGLQTPIKAFEDVTGHYRCFFPSRMPIGQSFAFQINMRLVVVDVEKIQGHKEARIDISFGSRARRFQFDVICGQK